MSSGDRINYQQLQMFMPAKQLIDLPFYEADREWIEAETEEYIDVDGITGVEGGGDYRGRRPVLGAQVGRILRLLPPVPA